MRISAACPECGNIDFRRVESGDFQCICCYVVIMPDEFSLKADDEICVYA